MVNVPANVYAMVNSEIGHIVDGKIVLDTTNVVEVRRQLEMILMKCACELPVDLLFKVVAVGDTVIIQMIA